MIKKIYLKGTPQQQGFAYGQIASAMISSNITNYQQLFYNRKKLTVEKARAKAKSYEPYIDPQYIEELKGIAEGANVAYEDILTLNCRSELLFGSSALTQECTAFAVLDAASADHKNYLSQTWDFARSQKDNVVMLIIDGKPKVMIITEAGLIGGKGLNQNGIGLTLNALNIKAEDHGMPLHIRMRKILECGTLAKAYETAVARPIPVSANLIIANRDGLAFDLELTPIRTSVLYPDHGILCHTNHCLFYDSELIDNNALAGSTHVRYGNIKHLLENNKHHSFDDIKAMLCDHKGYPNGICVHNDDIELPDTDRLATNHAVIMDLNELCLYYAHGNPCQTEFVKYELDTDI